MSSSAQRAERRATDTGRTRRGALPGARPTDVAKSKRCDLSVVVPVYNEEGTLSALCERLDAVLAGLPMSSEVILVDDGSLDRTSEEMHALVQRYPRIKAIRLRRNFGQTAALKAGFEHADGAVVVTMDADLQNPPEDIPKLLSKLDEGYDVVSGWRIDRKDPFLRRVFPSRIANLLIGWITGTRLHDYGCSLKAYRRDILDEIRIHGDMHRFIPAFAGAIGARIAEIPVRHAARQTGNSKYGLLRTLIVMVDMISIRFLLPYSFKPLKIFGIVGLGSLMLGSAINAYLAYIRLFAGQGLAGRPLLLLGLLLTILGVQLIVLGVLAELQVRGLLNSGERTYAVRERLGFGGESGTGGKEDDNGQRTARTQGSQLEEEGVRIR